MSRCSEDDADAFRANARKRAGQKFNEVIRRNTPDWDSPPQSDDQRAYSEDAIIRAAREFHNSTHEEYDWPSR